MGSPANICRKDDQVFVLVSLYGEPGEMIRSAATTGVWHRQCLVLTLVAAMPWLQKHSVSISSAAHFLYDTEQCVDEGRCRFSMLSTTLHRGFSTISIKQFCPSSPSVHWKGKSIALTRKALSVAKRMAANAGYSMPDYSRCMAKDLRGLYSPWTHLQQELHLEPAAFSSLLISIQEDQGNCST